MADGKIHKVEMVFDPKTMSMVKKAVPTGEVADVNADSALSEAIDAAIDEAEVVAVPKKKRRLRKRKKSE